MEPRTIVAIEIASSKIKGGVAAVGPDGRLSVLAVEEIPGTNNVRYGRIQNIREVSGAVNEIIRKLENSPAVSPRSVKSMVVSLGGRSLTAVSAKAALKFPHECEITENQVQRLMYEATRDFVGDKNIEAMVPRMFYVNNAAVRKAVGTFGETLRGEFMMLTCGKETRQNLDRLKFDTVEAENVEYVIRPLAVADLVLTPDERELGCALVDFGAETTTVSVYKDGTLAFLCTITMGSRLITLDLMAGLGITEEAAENYKLTLGTLADGAPANDNPNAEEVNGYVRARAGEIAANILNQIELSGYNAESLAKIVLVGGGSRLPEFAAQLGAQCKLPVRTAEMPAEVIFRVPGRSNAANIDIVALLAAGARIADLTCLSAPAPAKPAYVEVDEEEVEEDDDYADEEPEDDRNERREQSYKPERDRRQAANAGPRKPPSEDDDNLLDDDDDEEEDYREEPRRRGGFLGLGRKRREETAPVEDDDDAYEVFESDDDNDQRHEEDPDPDHFKRTKRGIDSLRDKFIRIFKSEDYDDEEV